MAWTVGQKAIVVRNRNGGPNFTNVEIIKVGRKWITVRRVGCAWGIEERFSMNGRSEENGGWGARLWASMSDFEANRAKNQAWGHLRQVISNSHRAPEHLSLEDIERLTGQITEPAQ